MRRLLAALVVVLVIVVAVVVVGRFAKSPNRPEAVMPTLAATAAPATAAPTLAPAVTRVRVTPTPDPATVLPESLTAALDPALDPDYIAPRAPITVTFDRPVNSTVFGKPLVFVPSVNGVFFWNEDDTAVTFNPQTPLRAGATYQVAIAEGLRGRDGATFAAPPHWTLRVAVPPQISRRSPMTSRGDDRRPEFRLTFSRAMNPASVAEAFSVTPETPVDLSWDGNELRLRPAEPLSPGTRYQFVIADTAADETGLPLALRYVFAYTPTPVITAVSGPERGLPNAPLRLEFGYPMAPETADLLVVEPEIAGAWRWDGETALVMDAPALLGNTTYTFRLSGDPTTAAGETLPAPDRAAAYTAPSPVLAVSPAAGQDVHPSSPVSLRFDRPMDATATAAALLIEPATPGEATWDGDTLIFTPTDGWETRTDYTITLTTAAADAAGRPVLGNDIVVRRFLTGNVSTLADFGRGPLLQVLDADGRRAVQFQLAVDDPLSLDFDLLPIDEAGLVNRLSLDVTTGWDDTAEAISDDGLSSAYSWTTTTQPGDPDSWGNAQETTLPSEATPGLYLLRLNGTPDSRHLILALSRMTLVVKLSPGQLVAWVSDLPTYGRHAQPDGTPEGGPTANAAVRVYAANGRLLGEGTTDARGVARLALDDGDAPHLVVAQAGDDLVFSGLTRQLQSYGPYYEWGNWEEADFVPPVFSVHVQTDRPIYRPGQTVYYKAILRFEDDGTVILPPAGTQAIVRLRDSRDNVVRTKWLATDAFGAVYDSFSLAEGAMLGQYTVEVQGVGPDGAAESHEQTFEVQEYRKPDFSVTVTAPAEIIAGQPMTVTIRAEYLFGQPVARARVEVNLYELGDYYFGDEAGQEYTWYGGYEPVARVTTGDDGLATVTVTPEDRYRSDNWWGPRDWPWKVAVEATVDDGSAQAVSASAVTVVYRAAEALSLDVDGYVVVADRPFPVVATLQTTVGEPQPVAGRPLEMTLRQWTESGYYTHVVKTEQWTTGPDGRVAVDYTVPRPGYYRLRLTGQDEAGRQLLAEEYFYAVGNVSEADNFGFGGYYGVGLTADRSSYAPGETARLAVRSEFAGPALLTFQRAATRREMPVVLTPPITVVEVPILPEDAPNIHVTLQAWEPVDTAMTDPDQWVEYSRPDAELRTASLNLVVPVTDKTLTVTITPDRPSYGPRDTAEVVVRVTDAAGQPVSAQVALALVDEAIFLLRANNTVPLHDAFYSLRPDRVVTRHALAPRRMLVEGGGLGGGGGDDGGAPRSDFPDTAAWFPALLTDANGEARVSIALPDSLTTWRLTARAVTPSTQVGEARATFITQKAIIVRPILPREMTQGDQLALSAIVHNYSEAAVELDVTLSEDGGLLAIDDATRRVALQPGEARVVGWPVTVAAAGQARALVTAMLADGSPADAIELPLAARPLAVPVVEATVGDTPAETTAGLAFTVPPDTLPEHSAVTLEISRSPAGTLLNGLEFLTGFPYGCVEQTMSRALPNAVVSRAFGELGVDPPEGLDLDRLVNESAQRLYGFQHDDGGWGWWFDDPSTPYQTAWVVFGLATMVEAGHEIDPAVIERGVAYLNEHLAEADPRTRAAMLHSMAVAGQPNGPAALELAATLDNDAPSRLDAFALAELALALDAAGESDAAQRVMDRLAETAIIENGRAHWGLNNDDGQYNSKTMASATRSTALALSAFVKLRPGSELEPQIVRYLMNARRGYGWGTTNETAYAILGLTDHLLAEGIGDTPLAWSATLDGAPLAEGTLAAGELRQTVTVPAESLTSSDHALTIGGDGHVYYTLRARYAVAQAQIDADGPLVVERSYLSPVTRRPLGEIHVGDLVLVQITVRTPRPMYFMLVEDRPLGGLEPLNERLNTTSHVTDYGSDYYGYDSPGSWREYGYNYKEIRDGRVTFFISELSRGTTFDYLARATHSGAFVALPAEAWAMYEPEVWGRSASSGLEVAP